MVVCLTSRYSPASILAAAWKYPGEWDDVHPFVRAEGKVDPDRYASSLTHLAADRLAGGSLRQELAFLDDRLGDLTLDLFGGLSYTSEGGFGYLLVLVAGGVLLILPLRRALSGTASMAPG